MWKGQWGGKNKNKTKNEVKEEEGTERIRGDEPRNERGAIIKGRGKGGYGKGMVIVKGSEVKQRAKISQCILKRGGIFLLIFKRKITTQQIP